jgi:hypothetical protein
MERWLQEALDPQAQRRHPRYPGEFTMTHVQTLKSEKYWQQIVDADAQRERKSRNQKAIRDFMTFIFGLGAMALGVYLVEHQQIWLPAVQELIQSLTR